MDSGVGRLYFYKFAYNPVFGDLKSGIPALTLIPAPVRTHIFLNFPSFRPLTNFSYVNALFAFSSTLDLSLILSS